MPPILEAESLRMTFADPDRAAFLALDGMSLAVSEGEFLAVVGPSGWRQEHLAASIGRPVAAHRRQRCFRGQPLTAPGREIGFVFQRANLMPWRTALQNIILPLEISHMPKAEIAARVQGAGHAGRAGWLRRRLPAAAFRRDAAAGGAGPRAAIHEPSILLLDEPFGSLDALTRERMNAELLRIWTVHQRTVVMVTHSISEAVFLADRVLVMSPRPGRVAEFPVALPRPRPLSLTSEPEFMALARVGPGRNRGFRLIFTPSYANISLLAYHRYY